jgi:magnesium chelatase subunit I
MKLAMIIAAIDASVGGVLAFGDRGSGKSTTVRALAALLPEMRVVLGCPYNCDPKKTAGLCESCKDGHKPKTALRGPPVVDLPLGATEDRVVGALDLEKALAHGERRYEPGLLARANRGFLYIDEANLLEDHLVDLLLDVAASGVNVVEREGLSIRHPARFVLIGSGNPEEGELRPQLLDRFGLAVEVRTPTDIATRIEVVRRRDRFERDAVAFHRSFAHEQRALRKKILDARDRVGAIETPQEALERAAHLCMTLGTDGLRGELTLIRAGRALAAFENRTHVGDAELKRIAPMALSHRLRRNPLDESGSAARVERALAEVFK